MKKYFFTYITTILFLLFSLSCTNNKKDDTETTPSDNPAEITKEKDKILWFDAEANFERFSKKENITKYLKKTKEVGFNKVIVDVRPVQGDVLYKSDFMPALTEMNNFKAERDWDYLQFFIDEAKKLDIKVSVSTTIFVAGLPSVKSGPAYRDDFFDGKTAVAYTRSGFKDAKDNTAKVGVFLNPVLPDIQDYCLSYIKEIVAKYEIDSYILDYCRYGDDEFDFSKASQKAFEEYIGEKVVNFPADIFTWNADGSKKVGTHYKKWWEFRSMVIHDFIKSARAEIKKINPNVKLEYWSASWFYALYKQGQNWGSKKNDTFNEYDWASEKYKETGFAEHLDIFQCGTYLEVIFGKNNPESIEYGLARAKKIIQGDCKMYGTLYALNQNNNKDIADAIELCLKESDGLMVFDIVQVIEFDLWDGIKDGIDRYDKQNSN